MRRIRRIFGTPPGTHRVTSPRIYWQNGIPSSVDAHAAASLAHGAALPVLHLRDVNPYTADAIDRKSVV